MFALIAGNTPGARATDADTREIFYVTQSLTGARSAVPVADDVASAVPWLSPQVLETREDGSRDLWVLDAQMLEYATLVLPDLGRDKSDTKHYVEVPSRMKWEQGF